MDSKRGVQLTRSNLAAAILLLFMALLFWKLRIVDSAVDASPNSIDSYDLYSAFTPRTRYAFEMLGEGKLPHWNPYQLAGLPLLAVPATGLFYPLNIVYLAFDTLIAVEVSLILHLLLGSLGMFALLRHFGVGVGGALCSAVTFVWSGWFVQTAIWPPILAGMAWLPLTALLTDRMMQGARLGWLWLSLAVACQVSIGATEVLIHTLYVSGILALIRIGGMVLSGESDAAAKRGLAAAAAVGGGVLLAAPQFIPSLEFVQRSARISGGLSFAEVAQGAIRPLTLLERAFEHKSRTPGVTVGLLPLIGLPLALGFRRKQVLWIFGATTAALGALFVTDSFVLRLYYELPMGTLFRRAVKFLDFYAFGQALLVGAIVARLDHWSTFERNQLWKHPAWILCVLLAYVAVVWRWTLGHWSPYLLGIAGLLAAYGCVRPPTWRRPIVAALCVVQAASLFVSVGNKHLRGFQQPEVFTNSDDLMRQLRDRADGHRVYLSLRLQFFPATTQKQGMLHRLNVVGDYEMLVDRRYRAFFNAVMGQPLDTAFGGVTWLKPDSSWDLMRLTSTKYFVVCSKELLNYAMRGSPRFELVQKARGPSPKTGPIKIYEFAETLARAYVVWRSDIVTSPEDALARLSEADFDPATSVVLEQPLASESPPLDLAEQRAEVSITSYEPERVVIAADTSRAGILVLTDFWYPGWHAFVNDVEVPIHRANYLFRALALPQGRSEVRFEYRASSFHLGLTLCAATATVMVVLVEISRRRSGRAASPRRRAANEESNCRRGS